VEWPGRGGMIVIPWILEIIESRSIVKGTTADALKEASTARFLYAKLSNRKSE
jgi:hypothetical protein